MRVIRVTVTDPVLIAKVVAPLMADAKALPVRFLVTDDFTIPADFEEVKAAKVEGEKKRHGYPSVKVEITGTLKQKLRAYNGNDSFVQSVKASWEKWGKLSPGQIFWLEKKFGAS